MKIKNSITIAAPLEKTWAAIDDVPRLARCAPGAELLEQREDGSCVGTIGIKLGPVSLKFKGTIIFVEKNKDAGRVVIKAKGNEEKGRGTAGADVVFVLTGDGESTKIAVDSDIQLAGSIAQYGRGSALIQGTAQALMDQFARSLEADLNGTEAAPSGDISAAKVVAKGIWNASAQMFRKKEEDKS